MKKSFVRYNLVFSVFVLPLLVLIVLLALLTEPVTGDLTRLGGYLEEDFGWRDSQQAYRQSGFRLADTLDDYDRYYDVVVFGDSFSNDAQKGWQNAFHERTGLSIITLSMAKLAAEAYQSSGVDLEAIINSPQFQANPPRYFIFETVERDSFHRFHGYAERTWAPVARATTTPVTPSVALNRQSTMPTQELRRHAAPGPEAKIQETVNYLIKATNRLFKESDKTRVFELTRSDLFSSGRPDQLLVVRADVEKDMSGDAVQRALHGLNAIQRLVEANGRTRFLLLVFPDKLTVYAPYLKRQELAVPSYLPALSAHYSFPRLDIAFHEELQKGVKDLYLPNDTHAGYWGHRVAADKLIDFYRMSDGVVQ